MGSKKSPSRRSPSPKPTFARTPRQKFQDQKAKFEKLEDKYRNQRSVKELTKKKGKDEIKKAKSPERKDDAIMNLLMEMKTDMKDLKADIWLNNKQIDSNNKKIDTLDVKIGPMEGRIRENEIETEKKFENIRKEIRDSNTQMEENATEIVVETLKPKIREIEKNAKSGLRKLIKEELALQKEAEVDEESSDSAGEATKVGEPE